MIKLQKLWKHWELQSNFKNPHTIFYNFHVKSCVQKKFSDFSKNKFQTG